MSGTQSVSEYNQVAASITSQFSSLYSEFSPHAILTDLRPLQKISPEQKSLLEKPFSSDEIHAAIHKMSSMSFPGPDQIISKVYQVHSATIVPILADIFNKLSPERPSPSFVASYTILVPKKCTAITNFDQIRPISLCNADYKILSQALATRILPIFSDILSPHQIGYMPGRRLHDNVILLNHILQVKKKAITLFLDFRKAFDSISHSYLDQILTLHQFPERYISLLQFLRAQSKTTLILNKSPVQRSPIELSRGSRQGDPISGFLFNIAVNYLTTIIVHQCPDAVIKITPSIRINSLLYCDDTVQIAKSEQEMSRLIECCAIVNQITPQKFGFLMPKIISYLGFKFSAQGIQHSYSEFFSSLPTRFPTLSKLNLSIKGRV
eukprot:TRINITY_DN331_c0_g3_i6.p1 TRINITY_DN331_c0_g3~~TRINITY_DN331_c0_g3_i6.p1  ORF type:complete len:381 (-),score=-8.56 TRINITY_DN331_c0_g3_i6:249-1391(-)